MCKRAVQLHLGFLIFDRTQISEFVETYKLI